MKRALLLSLGITLSLLGQSVETIPFRVNLSSKNEIPAIDGVESRGTATVLVHVIKNTSGAIVSGSVDFRLNYALSEASTITAMHIHRGAATANGGVVVDSALGEPVAGVKDGSLATQGQVTADNANGVAALTDILRNPSGYYLNMHTERNRGGEMRGQLEPARMMVLMTALDPSNEVPPVAGIGASGMAAVTVIASFKPDGPLSSAEVSFDSAYTGFPDGTNFSGYHIHVGAAGANGPVVINTGLSGQIPAAASGNLRYDVQINPDSVNQRAAIYGLFNNPANYYVNIHTQANPAGAIRGNLRRTDKLSFQSRMSNLTNVPPIAAVTADAWGVFSMHVLRNSDGWINAALAEFDVNYRFPGAVELRGMHVHRGRSTESGAVMIDSGLSPTNNVKSATGFGNVYRRTVQWTSNQILGANLVSVFPQDTYWNLHTPEYPAGVVRAQVGSAPTGAPAVSALMSAVSDATLTKSAPGGLVTIFGNNLFPVPSSSLSFENSAPTQLNFTSVTIGGRNAAILTLGRESGLNPPDYIVAQVPVELTPGTYNVNVVTSTGASVGTTLTVDPSAPAIYYDSVGGIVFHLSDMTLVRPETPAAAGEDVAILTTGLGLTTPGLATGEYAKANPQANVVNQVTVSIGGQAASGVQSFAIPGTAGLYWVVAKVPSGVAGDAAVRLNQGVTGGFTSQSNSVNIRVQ